MKRHLAKTNLPMKFYPVNPESKKIFKKGQETLLLSSLHGMDAHGGNLEKTKFQIKESKETTTY